MDLYTSAGKKELIKRHSPRSRVVRNSLLAFIFGGVICALGECLYHLYLYLGADEKTAPTLVSISLIFIAATLTVIGVFDMIAKRAGAGTLVPITGFSNAITSQAIDAKSEGFVLGVGAKIFTVSGPVILFGLGAGVLYGIIYVLVGEIMRMI